MRPFENQFLQSPPPPHSREHPGSNFFETRRYFCKIADNSADTAVILLKFAPIVELLLRIKVDRRYFSTKSRYSRQYPTKKRQYIFLILMQKKKNKFPQKKNKRR